VRLWAGIAKARVMLAGNDAIAAPAPINCINLRRSGLFIDILLYAYSCFAAIAILRRDYDNNVNIFGSVALVIQA
jgi:hypothetical protein